MRRGYLLKDWTGHIPGCMAASALVNQLTNTTGQQTSCHSPVPRGWLVPMEPGSHRRPGNFHATSKHAIDFDFRYEWSSQTQLCLACHEQQPRYGTFLKTTCTEGLLKRACSPYVSKTCKGTPILTRISAFGQRNTLIRTNSHAYDLHLKCCMLLPEA